MPIRFYNSLTKSLQDFVPAAAKAAGPTPVYMYNCGPTVYDFAHIGNFRAFIFADILRRFLEASGYQVNQVMNITDVGHMTDDSSADGTGKDKMEIAGDRLKEQKKSGKVSADQIQNPDDPYQVAGYFLNAFLEDSRKLGVKIASDPAQQMPRATAYVPQMQALIQKLIERKHAYVSADGAVYYDIESFPDYGQLSGNSLDKLRAGAGGRTVEADQAAKKNPYDFLLWKPDRNHIMKWDSPWGPGYPGWHIECSAMSQSVLGRDVIDIHTGGEDNIFPHHECEIAQSRGASGKSSFANYWMHTRFLLVNGEKMSKSKGNFFTVRDVLDGKVTGRAVDPAVLRYELLKAHYRSNMNFTAKGLEDSASAVARLRDAYARVKSGASTTSGAGDLEAAKAHPAYQAFLTMLAEDLNMAGALAEVFKFLPEADKNPGVAAKLFELVDAVLGVIVPAAANAATGNEVDPAAPIIEKILAARAAKDFKASDALRAELIGMGYDVKISKDGVTATKKLA
jgi:cysteinyl-tRNA synthetase